MKEIFRSFRARKEIREISLEKRGDVTKMKNERWKGVRGISKKIWKIFFFAFVKNFIEEMGRSGLELSWKKFGIRFVK